MRKILLILFMFSIHGLTMSQAIYYRIKINTDEKGLDQLAKMGVTIEHGKMIKGKSYTCDFSEWELGQIKKSGLPFEILIKDVSKYYLSKSKLSIKDLAIYYPFWEYWVCAQPATPRNFRLGSMAGYYTYEDMLRILDTMRLKYPNLISRRSSIAGDLRTAEGRELYYYKISNKPDFLQAKPKILYTALHHAREPISATQTIFFMWYLLENYKTNATVKSIVDGMELYFIPCINPDGYVYNQTTNPEGGGLWRKNRRRNATGSFGVDLNRNYDYRWGYNENGSSSNDTSDVYRGTSAFSEPENQMLRNFCNTRHFNLVMNNHSYANFLIYPWGYDRSATNPEATLFNSRAANMTSCNHFEYGTWPAIMYAANGISDDWMYGEQTAKPKAYAFTVETGTDEDGFWPPIERIIPLSAANVDMNIKAANYAKNSPLQ